MGGRSNAPPPPAGGGKSRGPAGRGLSIEENQQNASQSHLGQSSLTFLTRVFLAEPAALTAVR